MSPSFYPKKHVEENLIRRENYADSGETNLSSEHLKTALEYARGSGNYPSVTNEAALWDIIDHEYGKRSN
jgi:hypothetical protein